MSDDKRTEAELTERPVAILDMVGVAAGATVSRVLLRTGGGSVTLFAFAAGQELSEHTAPFDALVHVLEGDLDLTVGGAEHRVGSGEVLLMPAGVPHALRAPGDAVMVLTMLRPRQ